MPAIPEHLSRYLRKTLSDCGPFDSHHELVDVFSTHELLYPWRNMIPERNQKEARIRALTAFLGDEYRADTKANALILFISILRDEFDGTMCKTELTNLGEQLAPALEYQDPSRLYPVMKEANPQNQRLMFTGELLQLLRTTQAVGKVTVPRIIHGKPSYQSDSGTGWLVAPGLALTCFHVIEARGSYDDPIDEADLMAQAIQSTLTFDYMTAAQGIEYRVSRMECYDNNLDYALLHLEDRSDYPLGTLGTIALELDVPFTAATSLYIIQHPKGQPQQQSVGNFIKYRTNQNTTILHSAPTEPGTSGAPVLNVTNWKAVALHKEEDEREHLRAATVIKVIVADIQQKRRDLYQLMLSK